jgi:methylated-DNA-[protein]-cysteine S-methyltransferase
MKRYLLNPHPSILLSIEATEQIRRVKLFYHREGFACQIQGSPPQMLVNKIFDFLECYLSGRSSPLPFLGWGGSASFTQRVLLFLNTIPFGSTLTYGQIAHAIGAPNSSRAVGGACGRNPFPLFLPCHRVLSKKGVGGFAEGLEIKKILLDFERERVFTQ